MSHGKKKKKKVNIAGGIKVANHTKFKGKKLSWTNYVGSMHSQKSLNVEKRGQESMPDCC